MRGNKKIIYWDSGIFIAWIKNEARQNNELDGIADCVEQVYKGQAIIAISSFAIKLEVLKVKMTSAEKRKFELLCKGRKVQKLPFTPIIEDIAVKIREHYVAQQLSIGSMDCTHLATAIYYREVDAFYTFDDKLLRLNGDVGVDNLVICKPPIQRQLRFPY